MTRCDICGKRRRLSSLSADHIQRGTPFPVVAWCRSVCRECSAAVLDMVLHLTAEHGAVKP